MNAIKNLRRRLARMPVGRQLYAAFSLILVLTAVVGGVALDGLTRVDAQAASLADKSLRGVSLLSDIRGALVESREFEVKHSRTTDTSYYAEYEEKVGVSGKALTAALAAYRPLVTDADERALLDKFEKGWSDYQKASRRVIELGRAKNQPDAADISDGLGSTAFDASLTTLGHLTQHGFDAGKRAAAEAGAIASRARVGVMGLLGAALVLGIGFAYMITRQLLRQLGGEPATATHVAAAVAGGDLTTTIPLKAGDTVSLMYQLRSMQQALAEAVTHVRQGSQNVATSSAEIAQGNQDLSQRTEEQASALQQTAATMDELGATVRNNADNAKQANQLAAGASAVAVKGGQVVEQVVETMKGINDSSRKIADIIGVIDSIAFQTNILALNAAVEAARAGEQGRGFAVVAAEVRSLAQRSATAAKEIKTLIQASVERVGQGTALVDQAGHTMGEIVDAIRRVADIVGEISSASVEQSAGVAQVGKAITQMDQTTQQNAALVEQSAAAAESMKRQAEQLVQAVEVFKLATSVATPRPLPTGPARPAGQAAAGVGPKSAGAGAASASASVHAPGFTSGAGPASNASATPARPVALVTSPAPQAAPALASAAAAALPAGTERRGPNRATNVARLPKPAAASMPVSNGTEDWESF